MSDDNLMPGTVNLESEPPTIESPPPVQAQVQPDAAPPPADEDEGVPTVDLSGQRLVPLAALKEAREALKVAKHAAAEAETLREKALAYEAQEKNLTLVRPVMERLYKRPDLLKQLTADPPPQTQPDESGLSDEDAVNMARDLDLYGPDGLPSAEKARKVVSRIMKPLAQKAQQDALAVVAPVQQELATGRATTLKQQYLGMKDKAGRSVNPQVLEQMWSVVPPGLVAQDPNVAGILYYAAKGYAAHHGLDEAAPAPTAPLITESPGGSRRPTVTFTDIDQRIASAMGADQKKYTETAAQYKPNSINVLE